MPTAITESSPFTQAATPTDGPGRFLIRLIDAGRGSSGVYLPETLKAAAEARVFKAGTHMRIDHQTAQERADRPEGSVWDTAAVLKEDARWDESSQSLVAEAKVYSRFRTMLAEMKDDIGVSIRANAEVEVGNYEGEPARLITKLVEANTVDFVTRAGRGGHVIEVLEAARVEEARNVGQWVESRIHRDFTVTADEMFGDGRLTREERIALSGAIGEALDAFVTRLEAGAPDLYTRDLWEEPPLAGAQAVESAIARGVAEATANDVRDALRALVDDAHSSREKDAYTWAWVRDFDETTVWFELEGKENGIYAQAYTKTDDGAPNALTGTRTEVRVRTEYVPLATTAESTPTDVPSRPAGQSTATESQEDHMATTQIEESELLTLKTDAGRATVLESERDTARKELAEAHAAVDTATAGRIVAEADVDFDELQTAGLIASAPRIAESGRLDADAFTKVVAEHAAKIAESKGAGSVRGFGSTAVTESGITLADVDEAGARAFGRPAKTTEV